MRKDQKAPDAPQAYNQTLSRRLTSPTSGIAKNIDYSTPLMSAMCNTGSPHTSCSTFRATGLRSAPITLTTGAKPVTAGQTGISSCGTSDKIQERVQVQGKKLIIEPVESVGTKNKRHRPG